MELASGGGLGALSLWCYSQWLSRRPSRCLTMTKHNGLIHGNYILTLLLITINHLTMIESGQSIMNLLFSTSYVRHLLLRFDFTNIK
jgi:hypothetical protein